MGHDDKGCENCCSSFLEERPTPILFWKEEKRNIHFLPMHESPHGWNQEENYDNSGTPQSYIVDCVSVFVWNKLLIWSFQNFFFFFLFMRGVIWLWTKGLTHEMVSGFLTSQLVITQDVDQNNLIKIRALPRSGSAEL